MSNPSNSQSPTITIAPTVSQISKADAEAKCKSVADTFGDSCTAGRYYANCMTLYGFTMPYPYCNGGAP